MAYVFLFLSCVFLIVLIIGLIKPQAVLFFIGNYSKRNRSRVIVYYGLALLISFSLFGHLIDPDEDLDDIDDSFIANDDIILTGNIGYGFNEVKNVYAQEKLEFNFERHDLKDGSERYLGYPPEGRGACILEVIADSDTDIVHSISILIMNDGEDDTNAYNISYLSQTLDNFTDLGDEISDFMLESFKFITDNPGEKARRESGNNMVTMSYSEELATIITIIQSK